MIANDTARDKSGRVRVESQSRAPCDGFCSSLKFSASPVVVLALPEIREAFSSKRISAYWTWCKNSPSRDLWIVNPKNGNSLLWLRYCGSLVFHSRLGLDKDFSTISGWPAVR